MLFKWGISLKVTEAPGLNSCGKSSENALYSPMEQAWQNWSHQMVTSETQGTMLCYRCRNMFDMIVLS